LSVQQRIVVAGSEWPALVAAVAARRDRAAFTRLFDHFAPRVYGYLLRNGCDAALAEELTQDTLSTLWRKAALFDPAKASLATWLYRVARNKRIDAARRDRFEPLDAAARDEIPSGDPGPDDIADLARREERVRAAIERLPADQLALVRLAFFESLSHSEIAAREGLPLGTVKSRLRLAFGRLRKTLEGDGVTDAG
jgi:RNA polymerase sigma-70 factor (ECF subfamily)